VEWDEEQSCFETLSREFAEFYCLHVSDECDDEADGAGDVTASDVRQRKAARAWTIEHVFFPAFRQRYAIVVLLISLLFFVTSKSNSVFFCLFFFSSLFVFRH
jgi:hypothetical protein